MKKSREFALVCGTALIVVTNAVALGGAFYNRSGEPESSLALSGRELQRSASGPGAKSSSGLTVALRWRVVPRPNPRVPPEVEYPSASAWNEPEWLDHAKMVALGFDACAPSVAGPVCPERVRHLSREVFVVLELGGSADAEMRRRVEQAARDLEAKDVRGSGAARARTFRDNEALNSRLFAVDAGLDLNALRERYPDRTRYAVVRGRVSPGADSTTRALTGSIRGLSADTLHVPVEMRAVLEMARWPGQGPSSEANFEARVAFGQRLEPWLVSAARR